MSSPRTWRRAVLPAVALLALAGLPAGGSEPAPCTETRSGGDWARYGQDLTGAQRQDQETAIGPATVAALEPAWTITGTGDYLSAPPIVAGGCVFLNTGGRIVAYDLDTGGVVWRSTGADTTGTFAVTVVDGRVHVGLRGDGRPRAAAFDVRDGSLLWLSDEIWFGYETGQQASAVVHDGIQVLFTTGPDFDPAARQGYGLIDAETGEVLYKTTTIPEEDLEAGYAGGGVWGTPSVDPETDYLYVGTSNPESKTREHAYDNAVIKVDLDRERPTFGQVVDSYKGTPDSVTGYDNPVCQTLGEEVTLRALPVPYGSSPLCGQLDVDFGNGPTLWSDPSGRELGALTQKSGVLHVFDRETMDPVWSRQLFPSLGFYGGNIGRTATDGETLYVPSNPGVVRAFDGDTGTLLWERRIETRTPTTGGNVALANGVVYWVGDNWLNALDAKTGAVLWRSPPSPTGSITAAVAVAGGLVLANHGGTGSVVAYRLGDGPGLPDVPLPQPSAPAAPARAAVLAAPGSASAGYATPVLPVSAGSGVDFINADTAGHDVIAKARGRDGRPLFRSPFLGTGASAPVAGVERLAPGSYDFSCSLHNNMTGSLLVQ